MAPLSKEIVFLSGKRTAFGSFNGSLAGFTATDLGVIAAEAAMKQAGVAPSDINHVIFGNVVQSSKDAIYLARHIGLRTGVPKEVPALIVNRLCGSGFQSLVSGAEQLLLNEADVVLAGGSESMSQVPYVIRGARSGLGLGQAPMSDFLWDSLTDSLANLPMGMTAENLAEAYDISRQEADNYGLRSQQAWGHAQKNGYFDQEIAPVEIKSRKATTLFDTDEHPRPDVTIEKLAKLPPVFKRDGGTVTAGNASGISDGAAAMVMTTSDYAKTHGLKPIARLVNWGVSGCEPTQMGIGPVPATKIALQRAGMTLSDMELVEVNEAFAPQYLAVEKALNLDRDITNVNGGAIALGHPLATSGTRLTMHLIYELKRRGLRYGLATACIGGGQGMSLIVEALD